MPLDTWLAFAAASTLLPVIPGPTALPTVSHATGWRAASPVAVWGALPAVAATLRSVPKRVGAARLTWLGVKLRRAGAATRVGPRAGRAPLSRRTA